MIIIGTASLLPKIAMAQGQGFSDKISTNPLRGALPLDIAAIAALAIAMYQFRWVLWINIYLLVRPPGGIILYKTKSKF